MLIIDLLLILMNGFGENEMLGIIPKIAAGLFKFLNE